MKAQFTLIAALFAFLIMLTARVHAQTEAPAPAASIQPSAEPANLTEYTVDRAVKLALERNPAVKAAREKFQETEAQTSSAFAKIFPTLNATLNAQYKKDPVNLGNPLFGGEPYNFYNFALTGTQPLYAGGQLTGAVQVARHERRLRELDLKLAERDVTTKTISAFFATLFAQRKIERLERERKRLTDLVSYAERRYRQGTSRHLEVLDVRTRLALLTPNLARARNDLEIRAAELANLLGESASRELIVKGSLEPLNWEELTSVATQNAPFLPELEQARTRHEQIAARRTVELSKHLPKLDAVGTWGRGAFLKSDLLDEFSTSWNVGLQLQIPIFSGLSSVYERRALASQAAQLDIEEKRLREQLSLEQIKAEKEVLLSRSIFDTARTALDLANKSLREATDTYRLGTSTYVQYFDSQRVFTEAEISFEQAKFDYIGSQARYFNATGWDLSLLVERLAAARPEAPAP